LLFDYDGTLVPIVEHPRLARLRANARRLLERLAQRPRVCVGIVSGRTIEDLKGLLCLPDLCLAGTGGLELDFGGMRITHPKARQAAALVAYLCGRLRHVLVTWPLAWVERKRFGLTVHYRGVAADRVDELRGRVLAAVQPFVSDLRILDGPMAMEITPDLGWNKATAVRRIVDHFGGTAATTLYAGDNANDADALEAVAAMGGIPIGVGPSAPSAARYRLPCDVALEEFLAGLDSSLGHLGPKRSPCSAEYLALYGLWKSVFPSSPI
jgi:trehalose 6-phosphate phosphatase